MVSIIAKMVRKYVKKDFKLSDPVEQVIEDVKGGMTANN